MSEKVFYKGLDKLTSSEPDVNKGDDIKLFIFDFYER